eukprot:COSAG06_NODE_3889_length_4802_cov_1.710610_4_plen_72_part_00
MKIGFHLSDLNTGGHEEDTRAHCLRVRTRTPARRPFVRARQGAQDDEQLPEGQQAAHCGRPATHVWPVCSK